MNFWDIGIMMVIGLISVYGIFGILIFVRLALATNTGSKDDMYKKDQTVKS
jgi:hypothetical protein